MEILIKHYQASNYYNRADVFVINKESSSSINVKKHFEEYIKLEDDTFYETVAYGCPSLDIAECLHALECIDITNGVDVIAERNFEKFKKYCNEHILPKYEEKYLNVKFHFYDFDAITAVRSGLYNDNFYVCDILKPTVKEIFCAELNEEVETIVDTKNIERFKEDFYYCKIEEIKEMLLYIDQADKEIFQKIIDDFDPETSFVTIEYLESFKNEDQPGRYTLLNPEKEHQFDYEELNEITSKMLALEKELNALDRQRTELFDLLMANKVLNDIFDTDWGSMHIRS